MIPSSEDRNTLTEYRELILYLHNIERKFLDLHEYTKHATVLNSSESLLRLYERIDKLFYELAKVHEELSKYGITRSL